jgi:hypothetical protein
MIRSVFVRVRRVVVTVGECPNTLACWLRTAYPQWAPRSCHVALVALCGQDGSLIEQRPQSKAGRTAS